MGEYDFERDSEGTIDARDLPKVVKKLGIMNPEPHLSALKRAGGCTDNDKVIDYRSFALNIEEFVKKKKKDSE